MNKKYIIEFDFGQPYNPNGITTEIKAETAELALNQAQGMLHGEWVNIIAPDGYTIRLRPERVVAIRIIDEIN